jgi:hypothetical protein
MKTSACNMAIRSLISAIVLLCASHGVFAAMTQFSVASGETFTFEGKHNAETVELTVNAGATMNFPASGNVYAFVYLKGSGTVFSRNQPATKAGIKCCSIAVWPPTAASKLLSRTLAR